ncbi:hypothetical protein BO83DRAFT_428231 [Aspergillus eucalypticola CBS 122712]|uniref:Uncharacterized protein n=1 Tax=Aspergillus eucalypticola (strain CBS 122712 / IBT 29274) TaxID=1448314 RepID=A0A317V9J9_ASPEC|nr:uncharacterized protein BO83DRAFT_428231 [Aspergillus eucalypticola CBS 122712]PWY70725.1 hypothetical protein BO83DRAFT_428231 [Aspergillus eucalypticola CBS 122712]
MKVKLACASDLFEIRDEIGQCDQRGPDTLEGLLVLVGCPFPEIEGERAVPREPTPVLQGTPVFGETDQDDQLWPALKSNQRAVECRKLLTSATDGLRIISPTAFCQVFIVIRLTGKDTPLGNDQLPDGDVAEDEVKPNKKKKSSINLSSWDQNWTPPDGSEEG